MFNKRNSNYLTTTIFSIFKKGLSSKQRKSGKWQPESGKQLTLSTWYISPQKIINFLLSIITVLIVGHLLEGRIINWLNILTKAQLTPRFFVFDQEANFPSLFSTFILGFSSLLLATIATIKKSFNSRYTKFWRALSLIFLYMAIDENCSIHELLIPILRSLFNTRGLLYFPWVIPAFVLLIILAIAFKDFIADLPPRTRNLFLLAAGIYIIGALGMEIVGGYLGDVQGFNTKAYWIVSTIEELLEMFGIVVFIYGLLSYLQSYFSELHFSLSFKKR